MEWWNLHPKHSSKCLDVAYFSMVNGGDILQSYCSGGDNQKWRLWSGASSFRLLQAKHSGLFADVVNSSHDHAADVIQWSYNGASNSQWWQMVRANPNEVTAVPYYKIVNVNSQKCLDVAYSSQANGANVLQANCTGTDNQLWDLENQASTWRFHGIADAIVQAGDLNVPDFYSSSTTEPTRAAYDAVPPVDDPASNGGVDFILLEKHQGTRISAYGVRPLLSISDHPLVWATIEID
jgi:hypothetical protein